jgi:hypothetical protein
MISKLNTKVLITIAGILSVVLIGLLFRTKTHSKSPINSKTTTSSPAASEKKELSPDEVKKLDEALNSPSKLEDENTPEDKSATKLSESEQEKIIEKKLADHTLTSTRHRDLKSILAVLKAKEYLNPIEEFDRFEAIDFHNPETANLTGTYEDPKNQIRIAIYINEIDNVRHLSNSSCVQIKDMTPFKAAQNKIEVRDDKTGYGVIMMGFQYYIRMNRLLSPSHSLVGQLYKNQRGGWKKVTDFKADEIDSMPVGCPFE